MYRPEKKEKRTKSAEISILVTLPSNKYDSFCICSVEEAAKKLKMKTLLPLLKPVVTNARENLVKHFIHCVLCRVESALTFVIQKTPPFIN